MLHLGTEKTEVVEEIREDVGAMTGTLMILQQVLLGYSVGLLSLLQLLQKNLGKFHNK